MANVIIYSTHHCPYCQHARQLLQKKQVTYTEIRIDEDPLLRNAMITRCDGRRTVPQIIINEQAIGGFDDLYALDQTGQLDKLLAISTH